MAPPTCCLRADPIMMDFLASLIPETARIFYEGSFYILLGFAIAGLLHEFLPTDLIARHLGREDPRSVATAALFGAPIPLCSSGVQLLPEEAVLEALVHDDLGHAGSIFEECTRVVRARGPETVVLARLRVTTSIDLEGHVGQRWAQTPFLPKMRPSEKPRGRLALAARLCARCR